MNWLGSRRRRRRRKRRSARLLEGWPLGVRLMALRERLSQAPVVPRFPEDGLARLDQAEAALRTARGEFEAAEREAQQAHAAAEAPAPDAALLAQREALRRLRAGRAGFERAAAALPDLRAEISSATARLQSDVQQFGDGWDLHRILAVDLSLPQRDALRSHRDQLAQTRQELREAAAQAISREADWATAQAEAQRSVTRVPEQPAFDREWLAARRSALAAARAQYSEAEARRRTLETEQRNLAGLEASPVPAPDASPAPMDTPPPADRAVLTARRSALSRVRTEMAVLATRRLNLEEESRLLATLEDPAAPSPAGPAPLGPTWLPFALAAAGALLVVVGVVGDRLPAAGAGVVLVVIAAALWQRGAAGRGAGAPQRVEDQKARVAAAAEAAGQAAVAFAQTAQALGLPDGADVSTLDDVEASIDREALALQSWEQGQRDRAQAGEGAAQRRQERMNEQRERVAVAMATAEREVLRLRAVVQAAGLPPNADAATFTTAEAALEAGRTALERWEQAVQDRARLEAQAQRLQGLQDQADTAHLAAGLAAESAAGAWRSWLAAQGLPQGLSPEGALELINTVEAVRRSAGEIDATRERLAGAEQEVAQFRAALMELTEAIGEGFPAGDLSAVGMYVDRLIERYDEALLAHERRQHLQEAATVARSQWERRRDALRSERTNLEALLALADAPDPEAFRERGRQYAERQALERDQAECVERLQALAGGGEAIAALLDALATADPDALRDRVEQRQGMVQALADQRDALRREQGKLDAEAAALERGGGAAALRAERDLTLEGLRGDAEQWATVTLAQALLRRALRRFEEERQPSVVRAAQEFYSNIVGRPGLRLYVPVGEGGLEVVEAEGRRTPEQLSRGAREQLYLSLRFGLIRELGQRSERLPVLVDDVLVNFDPERARRSAE
ncbi:MAG: hypothetical protein NTZ05_06115, partial [Chloroflexi bacterium]|nr:hypothetical protein [Chloroflexota bacterium]